MSSSIVATADTGHMEILVILSFHPNKFFSTMLGASLQGSTLALQV